ncbi:MAG: outer membrane lipoprotein chaperone LolA [Pseudomonadota bacterium]
MKRFLLFLMLILSSPLVLAESDSESLARQLKSVHTFSSDFIQEVLDDKNVVVQRSAGSMQFDRAYRNQALFYWKVNSPSTSIMYFRDGKIIFYDPELSQATIKKVNYKDPSMLPLMLLTGDPTQVLNNFLVTSKSKQRFMLQPKSNDKDAILLGVILDLTSEGAIQHIQYQLAMGSITHISFGNVRINQPLQHALFFEKFPKDTDFVEVK